MTETEFMKRLTPRVEQFLPVGELETLEQYTIRARAEHENRRAMIAACIVETSKEIAEEERAQRQAAKDAWVSEARKAFSPDRRGNCVVCGKYQYLTHAHHLYPLGQQYDDGMVVPDQSYVWLCPNHHAMVHLLINGRELEFQQLGRRAAPAILDLGHDEINAVMTILNRRDPGAR